MQDNLKVLKQALDIYKDRGTVYDAADSDVDANYERAAGIASLWLNKPISKRDVVLIMASVKMSRTAVSPGHMDSYVDLVNYVSFGASFSAPNGGPVASAPPTPPHMPLRPTDAMLRSQQRPVSGQPDSSVG